ncbi:hypothetical protein [Acidianus brierleyi]|uniref:Transcriptional regulator n=1 Tax=Acidianus brierleyi TaxID=41673 RepID=A0A2U9IFZ3_9CREN|nr:hypothetical protein [Acidianus brierleyi]AWR94939.1 hypothetical protein DFR85_10365 [Acidianus brierleyi]
MLSVFNREKDVHETASKIFSDGIMTLVMSTIITNNGTSEEELERKVGEKLHLDNIPEIVKEKVKSLEDLGVIERKYNMIVLTEFGVKVSKILKDMLKIYYETFTSPSLKKH